ncbi:MAG TPA: transglycosylase family protein [Microlunatus sp.]|nr:transglycosylase family protein [Microlunatus sp.]
MITIARRRLIGILAAVALAVGLSAGVAKPADAKNSVWHRVAKCESGGRWHINTGNGYFGGSQFSSGTWRAYGGKKYGRQAHKASKSEQIAIARRVLAGQGAGAWGGCARKAGLTKKSGKASRHAKPGSSAETLTKAEKKAKAAKLEKLRATKVATVRKKTHSLKKLAKHYHVKGGWKAVYTLNKGVVAKKPNKHIKHGTRITLRT